MLPRNPGGKGGQIDKALFDVVWQRPHQFPIGYRLWRQNHANFQQGDVDLEVGCTFGKNNGNTIILYINESKNSKSRVRQKTCGGKEKRITASNYMKARPPNRPNAKRETMRYCTVPSGCLRKT